MDRWQCLACPYIYDPVKGDPESGVPPGTASEDLADDGACPECGVTKEHFERIAA
ncbi:MAG TPA: rubredoxin [Burkholderiales bacterium]|nr:rubredoxin [Burkholderiales bacterium]